MACPNCEHTMAAVALDESYSYFHCPRCGTLSKVGEGIREDYVPRWTVCLDEVCGLSLARPGLPK